MSDLLQLWHILCGLDAAVKEADHSALKAVEVGAVVDSLSIHHQVHQEQGIALGPNTQYASL